MATAPLKPPIGLKWRSSYWFVTAVVGLGIAVDLLVYSIITPVMPFELERRGFSNVSSLTGWLLFAFSGGVVLSTIPIAMLTEKYSSRQIPLVVGLFVLIGSQIMLMEAPLYSVMCVARVLQGLGSSMVWVVGLALLCDSCPEQITGRQLGTAMMGLSVGMLVGPPAGGLLYSQFGFRGPCVFGIGAAVLDLIGRFLVIERKHAIKYGFDPTIMEPRIDSDVDGEASQAAVVERDVQTQAAEDEKKADAPPSAPEATQVDGVKPLSLIGVFRKLTSSRALVTIFITFTYGVMYSCQEPSMPLHLRAVWGLSTAKVGLTFLAAVIPTLFSSPLSGWYTDRRGVEWVTFASLALALPWWAIVIIQGKLALFIVAIALQSFFTSALVAPLTSELAAVARSVPGIGYGHVYGAFNLAYGIGTTVGPIAGGQMYDRLEHGWTALCLLGVGLLGVCIIASFFFTGSRPLASRFKE